MLKRIVFTILILFCINSASYAATVTGISSPSYNSVTGETSQDVTFSYTALLGLVSYYATPLTDFRNLTTGETIPAQGHIAISIQGDSLVELGLIDVEISLGSVEISILGGDQNFTIAVLNTGVLPVGTWQTQIQFKVEGTNVLLLPYSDSAVYTLTVVVPEDRNITATVAAPEIKLPKADVFNPNASVTNTVPTVLNFTSNDSWSAYIDATGFGADTHGGDYYFQVTSPVGNVTSYAQGRTRIIPGQKHEIARGTSTINTSSLPYTNTNSGVTVNYSWDSWGGKQYAYVYTNSIDATIEADSGGI